MIVVSAWVQSFYDLPLPLFAFILGLFGLIIGSFLNVVILRLPTMMDRGEHQFVWHSHPHTHNTPLPGELQGSYTLYTPASHCPSCQAPVRWWMNIPVISFVVLKGKCSTCKINIAWQYPIVEILASLCGVVSALSFGVSGTALAAMALLLALLTLTLIDLNTYLLPDIIVLPLLWLGLLLNAQGMFTSLNAAVWGAAIGYLSLWAVYQLFKLLTGKEGMGYGDFKLLAALGAWLGIKMILPIILFASLTGALIGGLMILSKRLQPANPIAFGPYLAGGGVLALFYGERIVAWYLGLLHL
jgi:leader peptidase (prepilin peptidase) / N-methyltransferase